MTVRLHIKICEAQDVLKMDTVGKSDPYVTLRLKSQNKKEKLKTQIISNTRNPVWNQEFDIIATDPNDVLLINMYDEDIKNDDKMMDELQFPISKWPAGGPLDREEIDIRLKKKNAGKLIFEVQSFPAEGYSSGISERAVVVGPGNNNSLGTNGCKVHIKAFDAKDVLKMDTVGKSDPYLRFRLKGKKETTVKTQIISNTRNPVWNQELDVISHDRNNDILQVDMYDEDIKKDDKMMDRIEIPLRDHPIGDHYVFDDKIMLKKKDAGRLHFEINFLPENGNVPASSEPAPVAPQPVTQTRDVQLPPLPPNAKPCKLVVQAIKAENLRKIEGKHADPYCAFNMKGYPDTLKRTKAISNDLNPVWNQRFVYDCRDWNTDSLVVNLYDEEDQRDEKMMNELELPLRNWPIGTHIDYQEEVLLNKKKAGRLYLGVDVLEENAVLPPPKAEPRKVPEPEPETETETGIQSRDVTLEESDGDYCNFTLGDYTSLYSTDFFNYSEYSRSLSGVHSDEKFHRHHHINDEDMEKYYRDLEKAKRSDESIKGKIVKCNGIPEIDDEGDDIYAVVSVITKAKRDKNGERVQTESISDSQDAVWNKDFDFGKAKKGDSLKVEIYKAYKTLGDQVIACTEIPLMDLKENEPIEKEFKLEKPLFGPKVLENVSDFGSVTLSLTHIVRYE